MPDHQHLPRGHRALDHVAIRVADRDAFADQLLELLDVHVIDRTERFTLIGPDFEHGKVTLLDASPGTAPTARQLVSLVLVEPSGRTVQPPVTLDNGLVLTFTSADTLGPEAAQLPRHALVGIALRSDDPAAAAAGFAAAHGMQVIAQGPDVAAVEVGEGAVDGIITLVREELPDGDAGMLDHVGVLVEDAAAWRDAFEHDGDPIDRWVEAPHSRAVFVPGPDDVLVEFVEQLVPMGAN
ncbi:MAG: Glyoxalase/bleomycin resistance protein/dioxygenase [Thermoleophilia bacterium]|nr:Glyoxalase/bleomycin resistance protein/dioxygenase [Thermoleophilia bacterium]